MTNMTMTELNTRLIDDLVAQGINKFFAQSAVASVVDIVHQTIRNSAVQDVLDAAFVDGEPVDGASAIVEGMKSDQVRFITKG